MLSLLRHLLYALGALALSYSGWVHSVHAVPHPVCASLSPPHEEAAMPDHYHTVSLFFLGHVPGAGALMVSTALPPEEIHWLPLTLCDGTGTTDDLGKRIDLQVSSWWLNREQLSWLVDEYRNSQAEQAQ